MGLISPRLRLYMKRGISFGQLGHSHPFIWNERLERPELISKRKHWAAWCTNVVITIVYSVFIIFRAIEVNLDAEGKYSETKKIYMQFVVFYFSFPSIFQTGLMWKKDDLCPCFDKNLKLMAQLNEAREYTQRMQKVLDLFLISVWYNLLAIVPCWGFLPFVYPNSPEMISSVILPESGIFRWIVLLPCALFQMYYIYLYAANAFTWIYTGFGFVFPVLLVLQEMKQDIRAGIQSQGFSREVIGGILQTYWDVEILRKYFHQLYCTFTVPAAKFVLMTLTVFCTYGAIRMDGLVLTTLMVLVGQICFVILVILMGTLAMLHTLSSEILFLMKSAAFQRSLNRYQKKVVASLTPIQIKVGSGYIVDKPCLVTVLKIVVDSTVSFLLANP